MTRMTSWRHPRSKKKRCSRKKVKVYSLSREDARHKESDTRGRFHLWMTLRQMKRVFPGERVFSAAVDQLPLSVITGLSSNLGLKGEQWRVISIDRLCVLVYQYSSYAYR
jgi:hypothetical protein